MREEENGGIRETRWGDEKSRERGEREGEGEREIRQSDLGWKAFTLWTEHPKRQPQPKRQKKEMIHVIIMLFLKARDTLSQRNIQTYNIFTKLSKGGIRLLFSLWR